jgi:hypothetical protein
MSIDLTYQRRYNCEQCPTRCDGRSKSAYIFADDLQLAHQAEDWLLAHLTALLPWQGRKTPATAHGLPDLELRAGDRLCARIEVKAQGRAFMAVERLLPHAALRPYETVALNLSDLERYMALYEREHIPLFIIWCVRRPCLGAGCWGQTIAALRTIYQREGERRRYRRRSTASDYVDGQHKGVTVNYHFSLRELLPLEDLEQQFAQLLGVE